MSLSKYFDPTVNLGHVLTIITFVAAGGVAWSSMNTRVTLVESRQETTASDHDRLVRTETEVGSLKDTLSNMQQTLVRIDTKVSAKPRNP